MSFSAMGATQKGASDRHAGAGAKGAQQRGAALPDGRCAATCARGRTFAKERHQARAGKRERDGTHHFERVLETGSEWLL